MSNQRFEPSGFQFGTNPFAAFMQPGGIPMPFGKVDAFGPGFDVMFKSMARWNLEVMGFMSRRAQAYLEIPARLSQCRTPQDLFNEQTRFWRTAMDQYMDSSRKLTALAGQVMPVSAPSSQQAKPRTRDYISVPLPGGDTGGLNGSRERRVA